MSGLGPTQYSIGRVPEELMLTVTWAVVSVLLASEATCNSQVICDRDDCPGNAYCVTSGRRWYCTCGAGNRFNVNGQCEDIDECSWNLCSSYGCVNYQGSYDCQSDGCNRGFVKRNGRCEDIDECSWNLCSSYGCVNSPGSYDCQSDRCLSGFIRRNGKCQDIDECTTDVCERWTCKNYPGYYRCISQCPAGYTRRNGRCKDRDECDGGNSCSGNAECSNTVGSYFCTCKTGFSWDGITCADLDECLDPGTCDPNADCVNVPGSFNCTCVTGFHGNGTNCIAIPVHSTLPKPTDSPARLAGVIIGGLVALFIVALIVTLLVHRQRLCPSTDVVDGGMVTGSGVTEMPTLMVTQDVNSLNRDFPAQTDLPEYEEIENTTPAEYVYLNLEDNSNNYSTLTTFDEPPNLYSRMFGSDSTLTPTTSESCPNRRNTYLTPVNVESTDAK